MLSRSSRNRASPDKEGFMSKFGELIKLMRKQRGMKLDVVAQKIKSHKGYVSGIENGKVNPPSVKIVRRFAKIFGCNELALVRLAWADKAPKIIREDAQRVLALLSAENSSSTDIVAVPLLNNEALAYPTEIDDNGRLKPATDTTLVLPRTRIAVEFAATIRDDSMIQSDGKGYATGDVVFLAKCDKLRNGGIAYVIYTANDQRQAQVRQVKLSGDRVTLEPLNKNHPSVTITQDDVEASYVVVGQIEVFSLTVAFACK